MGGQAQKPVKIVDSIMGTGKTTGIFNMMAESHEENPNHKFFYVSLFNSEVGDGNTGSIGRVHEELPDMNFQMPKHRGKGKKGDIKRLLKQGYNISTTHQSFSNFDKETIDLMVNGEYTLVIDEALDCISKYDDLEKDDLEVLIESGRVVEEEFGRLVWQGQSVSEGSKFYEIMQLCNTESLYVYQDELIMWEYPPLLLKSLNDVYVITYLFDGSIMSSWMEKNGIEYAYLPNNILGLRPEEEVKQVIRDNLVLLKSNVLNKYRSLSDKGENQFSSSWCKRNWIKDGSRDKDKQPIPPTEDMTTITKVMESCVTRTKTSSKEVFWTVYGDYQKGLAGKGYRQTPKNGLPPFLAFNTKATNDYRDHTLCMYGVNVFKSPVEINYLKSRGVVFNQDLYSLSEMVQFIFRGSIRKGEQMKLLVLSERMENLLKEWLYR